MKNKKHLNFEAFTPLFKEVKIVYKTPGIEVSATAEKAKEERANEFLDKLKAAGIVSESAAKILKDNPFKGKLYTFLEQAKGEKFDNLTANYDDAKKEGYVEFGNFKSPLRGEVLYAINWPKIKPKVDKAFAGKNVSYRVMKVAVERNDYRFKQFVQNLFEKPTKTPDKEDVDAVLENIQKYRPLVNLPGTEARETVGKEVEKHKESKDERDKLKKSITPLPDRLKAKSAQQFRGFQTKFNKLNNRLTLNSQLNLWKVSYNRENLMLDANKWNSLRETTGGLQEIWNNFNELGIIKPSSREYYEQMFSILANPTIKTNRPQLNTGKTNEFDKYFKNPTRHRKNLVGIGPTFDNGNVKFVGGDLYMKAYDQLKEVQKRVLETAKGHRGALEKQAAADQDPWMAKASNFLTSNKNKLQAAVRAKDWPTVAMYAGGIWACYRAFKKLTEGKEGNVKKWLFYGGALYALNVFCKNAGYDLAQLAGFKKPTAPVEGTSSEYMYKFLKSRPDLWKNTKDLDYSVVARMSEAPLGRLYDLYKQADKPGGVNMILPSEFPDIFPKLGDFNPFEMATGQKGLEDYTGTSHIKLTASQKEFVHVGTNLYWMMYGLENIYNETLHVDSEEYQNKSFGEALKYAEESGSKLRHFMDGLRFYGTMGVPKRIQKQGQLKTQGYLQQTFENEFKNANFGITNALGGGAYEARVKGYPVVVVPDKDGYRIYLKNNFGSVHNPGVGAIAVIPYPAKKGVTQKSPTQAVEIVLDAVKTRMLELFDKVNVAGGSKALKPTLIYDGTDWTCKFDLPQYSQFPLALTTVEGVVSVYDDGMGLRVLDKNGEVLVNLDEMVGEQYAIAYGLLPMIVKQENFKVLRYFQNARKLRFKGLAAPGSTRFTLEIGKHQRNLNLDLEYENGKFKFVNPKDEEKLLARGSGFSEELKDVLRKDRQLNDTFKEWMTIIENTPNQWFVHFFEKFPDIFKKATLSYPGRGIGLKNLSGPILKLYTIGLLEAQREMVLYTLEAKLGGAKNFTQYSESISKIFYPAVQEFKGLKEDFASMNSQNWEKGKKMSEADFKHNVFEKIAEIGLANEDYKSWYKEFIHRASLRYGMDNFRKKRSINAKKLIKVFAHYTAVLDDMSFAGANPNLSYNKLMANDILIVTSYSKTIQDNLDKNKDFKYIYKQIKKEPCKTLKGTIDSHIKSPEELKKAWEMRHEVEKADKYNRARGYANYVMNKIFAKFPQALDNVWSPGDKNWGITYFDKWKPINQGPAAYIDPNPRLKMRRDYTSFEDYLALPWSQKKKIQLKDLVLPKGETTVLALEVLDAAGKPDKAKTRHNYKILFQLLGVDVPTPIDTANIDKTIKKLAATSKHDLFMNKQKTEMGEYFAKCMKKAFNSLEKAYTGKQPFDDFMRLYFPTYGLTPTKVNYEEYNFTVPKNSLDAEVAALETSLFRKISSKPAIAIMEKTITCTEQKHAVAQRVANLIKERLLDGKAFDDHFKRDTMMGGAKNAMKDFVAWLTG